MVTIETYSEEAYIQYDEKNKVMMCWYSDGTGTPLKNGEELVVRLDGKWDKTELLCDEGRWFFAENYEEDISDGRKTEVLIKTHSEEWRPKHDEEYEAGWKRWQAVTEKVMKQGILCWSISFRDLFRVSKCQYNEGDVWMQRVNLTPGDPANCDCNGEHRDRCGQMIVRLCEHCDNFVTCFSGKE